MRSSGRHGSRVVRQVLLLAGAALTAACVDDTRDSSPPTAPPHNELFTGGLEPLSATSVPQPVGGDAINEGAAIRLGKALFWDVQVGGDGETACASCHFNAGADNRQLNTVNPGNDSGFSIVGGAGQWITLTSFNADDRIGSQGVVKGAFLGVDSDPNIAADLCSTDSQTGPYYGHRRVTDRNAPSAIGAVFNHENFWDGRASAIFNGLDPRGESGAGLLRIGNSSLASQAVGPPNNDVEMSCAGRTWRDLAVKLLARRPLSRQLVSTSDGVLGGLSRAPASGLHSDYRSMIEAAFGATLATTAEDNFPRIFGQAIQAYESTLIPSQTPLDRYLAGNGTALTASQLNGFKVFVGKAGCLQCHQGNELSDATVAFVSKFGEINADGGDQGFHNIGVRPTEEDLGRALFTSSSSPKHRGAFKTSQLRNVKLTAPYFHNGGKATLEEVVDFYMRGGDFANVNEKASRMKPFSLTELERADLVEFLRHGLTDCRVEKRKAPFDHPSLVLPNGSALSAVGRGGIGACPP